MSAYFNLGQMSAQAAVMRVKASKRHPDGVKAFVEQGVVRRELSDNLCFYNGGLDVIVCFFVCCCLPLTGSAAWSVVIQGVPFACGEQIVLSCVAVFCFAHFISCQISLRLLFSWCVLLQPGIGQQMHT